ncbi:thioredoxin family protein [Streptomyces polygonati]|uniref:Thioredoxin family protein n=1 Tax=Streptomyces polygonati TaxID=1617087 RepID=A0ABV8HVL7_9ACTN
MGGARSLRVLAVAGTAVLVLAGCGAQSEGSEKAADGAATASSGSTGAPVASSAPVAEPAATPTSPAGPEGYDPTRDAAADITAAERASAKDGRPVLIDFGADWCPDCRVLGATFARPATAALLAGYHVVRVDVGEFDHNLDVAAPYVDLGSSGIPALTVVNSAGRTEIATNKGEFANARSMPESQVDAFLKKWA